MSRKFAVLAVHHHVQWIYVILYAFFFFCEVKKDNIVLAYHNNRFIWKICGFTEVCVCEYVHAYVYTRANQKVTLILL